MRSVTTEYRCDACDVKVENVRGLERFTLIRTGRGRAKDIVAATDLCADCESKLLAAITDYYVHDLTSLHSMSRVDEI